LKRNVINRRKISAAELGLVPDAIATGAAYQRVLELQQRRWQVGKRRGAARERAVLERLPARFEVGDCEAIPCADHAFDVSQTRVDVVEAHLQGVSRRIAGATR
jgi:hypothetical protein